MPALKPAIALGNLWETEAAQFHFALRDKGLLNRVVTYDSASLSLLTVLALRTTDDVQVHEKLLSGAANNTGQCLCLLVSDTLLDVVYAEGSIAYRLEGHRSRQLFDNLLPANQAGRVAFNSYPSKLAIWTGELAAGLFSQEPLGLQYVPNRTRRNVAQAASPYAACKRAGGTKTTGSQLPLTP